MLTCGTFSAGQGGSSGVRGVGDLRELLRAIREVSDGHSVIDPKVVEALVNRRARP
jgi:hypothetical protein